MFHLKIVPLLNNITHIIIILYGKEEGVLGFKRKTKNNTKSNNKGENTKTDCKGDENIQNNNI